MKTYLAMFVALVLGCDSGKKAASDKPTAEVAKTTEVAAREGKVKARDTKPDPAVDENGMPYEDENGVPLEPHHDDGRDEDGNPNGSEDTENSDVPCQTKFSEAEKQVNAIYESQCIRALERATACMGDKAFLTGLSRAKKSATESWGKTEKQVKKKAADFFGKRAKAVETCSMLERDRHCEAHAQDLTPSWDLETFQAMIAVPKDDCAGLAEKIGDPLHRRE